MSPQNAPARRKTCPFCRSAWKHDPADGEPSIMGLRIVDFVKGLALDSNCIGLTFQEVMGAQPSPLDTIDQIARRMLDIDDGLALLDSARDALLSARNSLSVCPAVQTLPYYILEHTNAWKDNGLATLPAVRTERFLASYDRESGKLSFEEVDNGE